jgi:hypothetical protein
MFAGAGLGLGLILAGLVFTILVWAFLRLLPRHDPTSGAVTSPTPSFESQSNDAVIVIQSGGRVEYMNRLARDWFGMRDEETADLERLARRARPSDEFMELCAAEGQKRFSINGRLTDATSYRVPGYDPMMLISLRNMDLAPALSGGDGGQFSSSILKVVADFSQTIPASLDLETTLLAIFQNVGRLVSVDVMEIKVADPKTQSTKAAAWRGLSDRRIRNSARCLNDCYPPVSRFSLPTADSSPVRARRPVPCSLNPTSASRCSRMMNYSAHWKLVRPPRVA